MVPTYSFEIFQNKTCPCGVCRRVTGSWGGGRGGGECSGHAPRIGPNSFIFMQFSAKILPSNRLGHPCLCGCRPHREILDPPLAYLCSASLFLSLRLLARSLSSSAARCRSNSIRLEGSISSYRFLSLAFFFDGRPR